MEIGEIRWWLGDLRSIPGRGRVPCTLRVPLVGIPKGTMCCAKTLAQPRCGMSHEDMVGMRPVFRSLAPSTAFRGCFAKTSEFSAQRCAKARAAGRSRLQVGALGAQDGCAEGTVKVKGGCIVHRCAGDEVVWSFGGKGEKFFFISGEVDTQETRSCF